MNLVDKKFGIELAVAVVVVILIVDLVCIQLLVN